ncbi:hypothetical protein KQI38_15600 [Tissierella carlieri]|uniref:hypothetical protein n=1 Tax=Tissierella carlieri TaxID=689904 RepID=UPI001C118C6D|nr:hypothetical protein [Tissierella carlieri]MBU5313446.1 hypothetical protein [Tissierella carlieri]
MAWVSIGSRFVYTWGGRVLKLSTVINNNKIAAHMEYVTGGTDPEARETETNYYDYYAGTLYKADFVWDEKNADGYLHLLKYIPEPPSIPSSISVPSTIKGGEIINISWGSSSGASSYYLERSVNGGSWASIYSGGTRSYTDTISKSWNTVAYRVRAYNSDGFSGYTTSPTRTVINNTPPTISGSDSNLGDKNLGFVISYQVDDADVSDTLIVTEKLNGSTIKTINGAPRKQNLETEITNETLFSLPLNSENTVEIKVDDQKGGIAYRRYTFRRTNTAPIIDGQDEDLGQKSESFSIDFSVTDNEGNTITVKTYLDGIKKEEYQVEDGATNTFTISSDDWYKLGIGNHSIKIEAIDEHGATAIRNYTFTRYDDKIKFTLKNPIETDMAATKILVTPTWVIPIGANAKVEVCNNGYDEVSTWEDITSQVSTGKHYIFTNDVKTADKWGIDIRFTIEKGTATEECIIYGFGGAFE